MYLANVLSQRRATAASNINQAVHRAKSSDQLQVINGSLEYPTLLRDKHYALPTIQGLQPFDQLLILTPPNFPNDLVTPSKQLCAQIIHSLQLPFTSAITAPYPIGMFTLP